MVEKIIDYSVKNLFLVLISTLLLVGGSFYALKNTSLDALPDLSPPQVIVQVKWDGQAPKLIEEQVSYPLTSALLSLPNISTVRAMSSFSNSLIYVIFKDGTDLYKSRDRILEKLSELNPTFPKGASVTIGPDATGVGWAYEYALTSKTKSLDELRTLQDYYFKYALLGVDGVSEVAPIGGFIKSYEITLDQDKLVQYNLSVDEVRKKISLFNADKGGRLILENGFEHLITVQGYLKNIKSIEDIIIKTNGTIPLKVSDIAQVNLTSKNRRGMADLNGEGETVGGIVIVRFKENPYQVIEAVKSKLETLKIDGVDIVETYDRTSLIDKAIDTLKHTLFEESLIVLIVTALFLFHLRSSLIIIISLPITVLITFLLMNIFDIGSNIMSLGGIAIAIGAMVDASIVMVENAHKHLHKLELDGIKITEKLRVETIIKSAKQVGPPIFFALLLVVASFMPIFALEGQEGALFTPLAFTKTFAMLVGAILSITLIPILMIFFIKGKIIPEEKNPINKFFQLVYMPLIKLSLRLRYLIVLVSLIFLVVSYKLYEKQNWEFMPMMNEQTFMYMPVTPYGLGIDKAKELTQKTDQIIKSFPEVDTVFGKAGRADTATDPAPLAMIETIINFKPEEQWREGMTYKKLMAEMDKALQVEGLINSWTYPIRGRIDMLLTGIRTPLGIKLYGNNNEQLAIHSLEIEQTLQKFDKTLSVSSDKTSNGYYLNIKLLDENLSRYGITKQDILNTISYGVGGAKISTMYEGLERYPITVRYDTDKRGDINDLNQLLIKTKIGYFPLETFADLKYELGASVIKSEKGMNVNFTYITPKNGVSPKEYKDEANELLKSVKLPTGYYYEWAGQSEYLESAMNTLIYIIPFTLVIVFILIYFALKNMLYTSIIFFTLPIALAGGVWGVYFAHINISVAVIVGFIALLGIAAETSIVMMVYLDEAFVELQRKTKIFTKEQIKDTVINGAALRLRPKLMTVFAILGGLIPILYIDGVGSEVMRAIATPMIGGMVTSAVLTLLVIPSLFYIIKLKSLK
ncbi:CusA/CzcA family heavy metal efflux RND transporter [Arcobacteraceae bacterium]|nr:CusA/CzcA family heavy metal efflux RND transporter [Arcobacteraceae bacterium]